jgi:hypothetical protein
VFSQAAASTPQSSRLSSGCFCKSVVPSCRSAQSGQQSESLIRVRPVQHFVVRVFLWQKSQSPSEGNAPIGCVQLVCCAACNAIGSIPFSRTNSQKAVSSKGGTNLRFSHGLNIVLVTTSVNLPVRILKSPAFPLPSSDAIKWLACSANSEGVNLFTAYFSPSWTAFQTDCGRDFSVIVDAASN